MNACQHRYLDYVDGAVCILEEHPATPNGHAYKAGNGSDVPDRHDATSGGEH